MTAQAPRGGALGNHAASRSTGEGSSAAGNRTRPTTPSAILRRTLVALVVAGSLAGGALTIRAAGMWTAEVAVYPLPVPGIAQLAAQLADEQARADALQAQLDQLVAGSTDLALALDEAGGRLAIDAGSAESLRAGLVAARARLAALQQALAAAGAPVPTRPPAAAVAPAPIAASTGTSATTTTGGAKATSTYPPGVPADWPAGQPIPSMPAGCVQPQLELSGAWNCQH